MSRKRTRTIPPDEVIDPLGDNEFPFVNVGASVIGTAQDVVQRIGNAILGGDFSGNPRGNTAIDIQITRTLPIQVASGANAIVFGRDCEGDGADCVVIGNACHGDGAGAVAIGRQAKAQGTGLAVGRDSQATANAVAVGLANDANDGASAIGIGARAWKAKTMNLGGAIIVRNSGGSSVGSWLNDQSGAEIVIMTTEKDLTQVTDYSEALPAGCHFFITELGLIATSVAALVAQPTIRFGIIGTPAKQLAATATTLLTAAAKRDKWTPLVPQDGETSLSAGVTVGANAGTMEGRFYWKGLLVEDE
jgi:hypothetical protein